MKIDIGHIDVSSKHGQALLLNLLEELLQKVNDLEKENSELHELRGLVKEQKLTIEALRDGAASFKHPKNSGNSSVPPSKDENRPKRTTSLRKATGRKPGGQKGHAGSSLEFSKSPDTIERRVPLRYCSGCGRDNGDVEPELLGKRQIVDIPKIKFSVTEYQSFGRACSCGHVTQGGFPPNVTAPVGYGPNVEGLVGYLHTRQYVPFKRLQEVLNDVFGLPISEGGVHCLLNRLVAKAAPAYGMIKQRLQTGTGKAVGADETGMKVNGEKHWAWTWQDRGATFITISDNRGGRTIEGSFPQGFPDSVLVHDCWKSHFNTPALTHQICTAHLLRELKYLSERYGHKWGRDFKGLLLSAIKLKRGLSAADYRGNNPQRELLSERLAKLLGQPIDKSLKELCTFQNRMKKHKDFILTFLYHAGVPPDNNSSERAIRNIKVKQKISGQFRSPEGAFNFAVLRSITDTVIKNGQNVLASLNFIANLPLPKATSD